MSLLVQRFNSTSKSTLTRNIMGSYQYHENMKKKIQKDISLVMKCLTELTWCWLGTRRTGLPLPPEGAKQCYIFKEKFIIFLSFVNRCTFVLRNLWAAGEKIRMKSSDIHILKRLCHKCYFKYWGRDDHPRIAAGRTSNKENVAFQRVNLRIVNGLTRKRKIMLEWRGQNGAPHCK
jgi:hypothetical protein